MAAAARDHDSLDRRLANQARFAFAAVDPVLQLKEPFFAIGIHVVGNRRAAQRDGFLQHFLNRQIEPAQIFAE